MWSTTPIHLVAICIYVHISKPALTSTLSQQAYSRLLLAGLMKECRTSDDKEVSNNALSMTSHHKWTLSEVGQTTSGGFGLASSRGNWWLWKCSVRKRLQGGLRQFLLPETVDMVGKYEEKKV